MSKVVISGGGTGGHIYPGLAIADKLKEYGYESYFIGTKKGLESSIVPKANYPISFVNVKGFKGKTVFNKIWALALLPFSVVQSMYYLLKINPKFVVITGGYVSLPVALASFVLFKKLFIQEQNAFPGLVNRIASKFAKKAFTGFKDKANIFKDKEIFTGNPVRSEFGNIKKIEKSDKPLHLLITGGSQGSLFINSLIKESLPQLQKMNLEIIHLTGLRWFNDFKEYKSNKYKPMDYSNKMPELLDWSDLVISRAGASFLAEVSVAGRPLILIPLSTATDNHQYFNGMTFVENNSAIILEEKNANSKKLIEEISSLCENRERIVEMGQNAKNIFPSNSTEMIIENILKEVS